MDTRVALLEQEVRDQNKELHEHMQACGEVAKRSEARGEANRKWLLTVVGGMILMLLETFIRFFVHLP